MKITTIEKDRRAVAAKTSGAIYLPCGEEACIEITEDGTSVVNESIRTLINRSGFTPLFPGDSITLNL